MYTLLIMATYSEQEREVTILEKYIAFLRGINVGGKNKISMPALKSSFEKIGLLDVITYINSGNVIFSSDIKNKSELIKECESVITNNFKLNIPVTIITAKELSNLLKKSPDWWNIDKDSINYAIFLIPPITVEEIFTAIGEAKPEYEKVDYFENVIFWSAPAKTFSKTKWAKIASSSVNKNVTIRNANTVNKLLLMIK